MRSTINLASYIDHTLLKPDAGRKDIEDLCQEAIEYGFFSVCINPSFVELAKKLLLNSKTKVCSVVGFPLGQNLSKTKLFEAKSLADLGSDELDVVINISDLKNGRSDLVIAELKSITTALPKVLIKVILETSLLTKQEIAIACRCSEQAGAHFVKTSTGFGERGASLNDIYIMAKEVGGRLGIKASGGIKSQNFALELIEAGATRLGTSSGVKIVKGEN